MSSKNHRNRKTLSYALVHQHFEIDIKSAIFTLLESLESHVFNGHYLMLPYYVKTLSFLPSSEKLTTNLKFFQSIINTIAPEDTVSVQVLFNITFIKSLAVYF